MLLRKQKGWQMPPLSSFRQQKQMHPIIMSRIINTTISSKPPEKPFIEIPPPAEKAGLLPIMRSD